MNSLTHIEQMPVTTDRQIKQRGSSGSQNNDINLQGERIQRLIERIETLPYPAAKELIQELSKVNSRRCYQRVPSHS